MRVATTMSWRFDEIVTIRRMAKAVSRPHFGVGSDGLVLIEPLPGGLWYAHLQRRRQRGRDVRQRHAMRGQYVYDRGLTDKPS